MSVSVFKDPIALFPPDLLEGNFPDQYWWVARTKPRREKILAWHLYGHNIGYFLPLYRQRQPSQNRERYSLLTLFPGYVFLMGDLEARYQALRSNQIIHLLEVKDPFTLRKELSQIHIALQSKVDFSLNGFYEKGDRVRIKCGPLKGVEGIIVKKKSGFRLVLKVTSIEQAISINIDEAWVEPVNISIEPPLVSRYSVGMGAYL